MKNFYLPNTANYPRLKTDKMFIDYKNHYKFNGFTDSAIKFIENFQLQRPNLWKRFVKQFIENADRDNHGWRGEYWGKMMRGACLTYSYTQNKELYNTLKSTVADMMKTADAFGRISTYAIEDELCGWDIWARKYVLLGMQYFIEICDDEEFNEKIIDCMKAQLDYIISKIGSENGKKSLTENVFWRGASACSILEPVVRLYNLTENKKYFDFATYIVNIGGADVQNLFDLAYEGKLYPYQYPVTKAYEITSCFEGLLEYYRITGNEKYKTAVINFADLVLESDFTVIGSCGCTHELFDHSTVRQANTTNAPAQETCVTVTMMKFLTQVTLLTGDPKYVDAFEISLYNAYLGAINTEKTIDPSLKETRPELHLEPLPFDSYSPLTAGTRGNRIGGFQIMSDNHYYGCCACIGSAGIGLIPKMALLSTKKGFVYNLFVDGKIVSATPLENKITFTTETKYPKHGNVKITVNCEINEQFELLIRNPAWSKNTTVNINGEEITPNCGYISVNRIWKNGDVVEINLDMRTRAIKPIPYGEQVIQDISWEFGFMIPKYDAEDPIAKNHIVLLRGPIVLAQENRLGYSVDDAVTIAIDNDGYADISLPENDIAPYPHIIEANVLLKNGTRMTVTDYASAGKLWNEQSKMAAWILTE